MDERFPSMPLNETEEEEAAGAKQLIYLSVKTGASNIDIATPDKQKEPPTLEEVMDNIGFRFQLLMYSTILCGMVSGAFILYSLYYFQL
jgi:MFS family permease